MKIGSPGLARISADDNRGASRVNGFLSKGERILGGVPHWSILGLLLQFLLCINDLPCSPLNIRKQERNTSYKKEHVPFCNHR